MYICVCVRTYIYIYTHTHSHTHIYIYNMKQNIHQGKDTLTCTMLYVETQNYTSTGRYEAMNRNSDVKECFITGSSAQVSRKWDKARPLAANRTAMAVKNFTGDNVAHWRQQQLYTAWQRKLSAVTQHVALFAQGGADRHKIQWSTRRCRPAQNTMVDKEVQTGTKYTGRHEFPS